MPIERIQPAEPMPDPIEEGSLEKLADGFQFTEGPVWLPQGFLLFSDIPASRHIRWSPDGGCSVFREGTNNSNGLTLDRENRLIACEHTGRRVARYDSLDAPVEKAVSMAERWFSKRLNSPNDVVTRSDGAIFFTDPPYGIKDASQRDIEFQGVFALRSDRVIRLLAADFNRPNGIALSPDEQTLYVNYTAERHIRAFRLYDDCTVSDDRLFCEMQSEDKGGPDGMKVDQEGNVYSTGPGGLWIFDPIGRYLGRVVLPEQPANCAFGGEDGRWLFMTARTGLYRVRVKTPGILPGNPNRLSA